MGIEALEGYPSFLGGNPSTAKIVQGAMVHIVYVVWGDKMISPYQLTAMNAGLGKAELLAHR